MGPEGAVNILYKREIDAAPDKDAARARRVAEFKEKFANPYVAASRGFVDEVIRPRQTRAEAHRRARDARDQARQEPAEEARKHSALSVAGGRLDLGTRDFGSRVQSSGPGQDSKTRDQRL